NPSQPHISPQSVGGTLQYVQAPEQHLPARSGSPTAMSWHLWNAATHSKTIAIRRSKRSYERASMLKKFAQDLWIADGTVVSVAGFNYPTRMAVIKLSDSSLVVWSPIKLTEDLRVAVGALGPAAH